MLKDMYNRETTTVYKFLVFTTQTVEQTARTTGGKELLLRIDRAIEKNSARAEQEELAPSLAAGRSPRTPLEDDVPYKGASAVVLASEHAPLPSPHQRTAFLSRFIQCHESRCFLQIYIYRRYSGVCFTRPKTS